MYFHYQEFDDLLTKLFSCIFFKLIEADATESRRQKVQISWYGTILRAFYTFPKHSDSVPKHSFFLPDSASRVSNINYKIQNRWIIQHLLLRSRGKS